MLAFIIAPFVAFVPPASAYEGEYEGGGRKTSPIEELSQKREEAQERTKAKLDDAKKRVCENRQKNIEIIMKRGVTRAENQTKLFGNIADRVKAFYEKKGKTIANFDELVTAIDDAKAHLAADVQTLKAAAQFDCDSDNPKGEGQAYKEAHEEVLIGLKEYRTAVKNLIVAVRGAQGDSR